ncbi:MAG TPA: endonuclease/exonuclease/phosphatase family protein, partial [Mycobacterium sp.]|nr:endonuclease/exonuclease/phosphatase family protein [Mycobacterium sp.]
MIVTTVNVNGIRAAVRERSTDNPGLLAWLKETRADVVCLQETRADDGQLTEALAPALADGWQLGIEGCDFRDNTSLDAGRGGALMVNSPLVPTFVAVRDTRFLRN